MTATAALPAVTARAPRRLALPVFPNVDLTGLMRHTFAALLGLGVLLIVWSVIAHWQPNLPGPLKTWASALTLFADPFYVNGPNDVGIGWNILHSLMRVGLGFGLAAVVGIPLGFAIGRFDFLNAMAQPVISLLRPVSPLAWLPIGLLVFQKAGPAAIYVIFISSMGFHFSRQIQSFRHG